MPPLKKCYAQIRQEGEVQSKIKIEKQLLIENRGIASNRIFVHLSAKAPSWQFICINNLIFCSDADYAIWDKFGANLALKIMQKQHLQMVLFGMKALKKAPYLMPD